MIDLNEKKNKHGDTAHTHYYKNYKKSWESFEEEKYSLRLPLLNTQINYHFRYYEFANTIEKEQEYDILRKVEVTIGKDKFDIGDNYNGKIVDFNGLVEAVVAYVYAKDNLNEFLLDGKTKRELKKMDLSDLEVIMNQRTEVLNNIKEVIKAYTFGRAIEKTGQQVIDEVFGENKVALDKIVEENVEKELAIKEKQTDRKIKIENFKAKVGIVKAKIKDLKLISEEAVKKLLQENGEKRLAKAEIKAAKKEAKNKKRDIIDELSM